MALLYALIPLLASLLLTSAAPTNTPSTGACTVVPKQPTTGEAVQQPTTGDAVQLPTSNLTLQYITIGHGIQNYTCASATSTPVALGALATLYDVTNLQTNMPLLNTLPAFVAWMPLPSWPSSSSISILPGAISSLVIGHHYFNAAGTPTFDLSSVNSMLIAKKVADIKAPADANKGMEGTGAVDWLYLNDKGGSVGVSEVYRIQTAGGMAPTTCQGQGTNGLGVGVISVPYAAEYWFYG